MNKDVIYIDVDDDITAIIGKIKKAKEKVVALVPPKRAGVLQSAVNLRLLERMARNDNKQLVLVTHSQALVALAASAQIPVAKNLQSKPELAEVPALIVDDGDDIIDGSQLPVGEHAKTAKTKEEAARPTKSEAIESTDLTIGDDDITPAATAKTAKAKKGKDAKIPNFDSFRKRLVLGITGGVALIGLLIWMFVFAPAASVIITASTEPHPLNSSVKLGGVAATDFQAGVISSVSQEEKVDATVEFEATGQRDVGEKASGSVVIRNCDSSDAFTIDRGTAVSAGSQNYIIQSDISVGGARFAGGICTGPGVSSPVEIVAQNAGESYNQAGGTTFAVAGFGSTVRAIAESGGITGGTTKIAKVVSAGDIERARGQLIGQSTDAEKKALINKFSQDEVVIESSFTVDRGTIRSSPAVNQEAPDGKATLTAPTTYTMQAVARVELETYLKASLDAKIDSDTQKIYSSGADTATIGNFREDGDDIIATVNATGAIGPKINEDEIKERVKGKRYGEVQQGLEAINGIKEVDVQFSYFWVRTVPGNTDRISIEFKVQDE